MPRQTFPGEGFPAIPGFELVVPEGFDAQPAPGCLGSLITTKRNGFAPNLVVSFDRIAAGTELSDVVRQLAADAASDYLEAEVLETREQETEGGPGWVITKTFADRRVGFRLYQLTGCCFAPHATSTTQDMISMTGTCAVSEIDEWSSIFVACFASLRFIGA